MDLSEIVLTSVEQAEFSCMHHCWYRKDGPMDAGTYSPVRILAPFSYPDYHTLLREFLNYREADKVSVNHKGKWERFYLRQIGEEQLNRIAFIAANDRFKKGHLELYFHKTGSGLVRTKLKFAECNSQIVGYELICDPLYAGFFTWQTKIRQADGYIYGLWALEEKLEG